MAIHRQLFQRILNHTVQEMSDQRKDAAAAWERLLSNGSVSLPPDILEAVRRQHVVQRTPLDSQNLQSWSPFLQRQPMIQQGGWGGSPCILLSSQAMEWDYFVSYGRNVFEHVCQYVHDRSIRHFPTVVAAREGSTCVYHGCSQGGSADSCYAEC